MVCHFCFAAGIVLGRSPSVLSPTLTVKAGGTHTYHKGGGKRTETYLYIYFCSQLISAAIAPPSTAETDDNAMTFNFNHQRHCKTDEMEDVSIQSP